MHVRPLGLLGALGELAAPTILLIGGRTVAGDVFPCGIELPQ